MLAVPVESAADFPWPTLCTDAGQGGGEGSVLPRGGL